jgi:predicted CXXCH cytochrome family protein
MAYLNRILALSVLGAVACGSAQTRSDSTGMSGAPGVVGSNVEFKDYAGTQACARCHTTYVEKWLATPMHNMTRASKQAEVKGPFDGTKFSFKGDTATLTTENGDRYMAITSSKYGNAKYRLTRVIGGHHREDYAGVSVTPGTDPSEELVLPVSYVYATKSLRYKGWSVMSKEREGMRAGPVWNETCIFCHNTVPYLSTVLGALAGTSGYQGEVLDPLLPSSMRAKYIVTDSSKMDEAIGAEAKRLGGSARSLREAVAMTKSRFRANHLVEVGIGCESCHLGSAEHVANPQKSPSLEPRSPAFTVKLAKPTKAEMVNRVCARCHQVLFSGYDPTWEGGSRKKGGGGSHINSGEARDLMLGACASKMSCVDCHDPHSPDSTEELRSADAAKQDALCTKCHQSYASADALRAHSHHDPAKDGARCLNCHMPKKNMSLDGNLSRYHRIGSPNDMTKVVSDRPMECALCHVDKSVKELAQTMTKWWKKPYDDGSLERLYGSVDANVVLATAERGKPHEQAVAFQLLGDARVKAAVPVLAGQLTHPYPIVRGYAKRALDAIAGAPIAVDIDAPDDVIADQAKRLRGGWGANPN